MLGIYVPSARSAYAHASRPGLYERPTLKAIGNITFAILDNVLRQSSTLDPSSEVSHKLIFICPGVIHDDFDTCIPTRYLFDKLEDALLDDSLESAARFYSLFLRTPKT
jgi:hypothetical protein